MEDESMKPEDIRDEKKQGRLVVYNALFGDYDDLIDPPEKFEGCDFVCFTDQENLKSDIWEIRLVKMCDLPPNMMNRKYKLFPNIYLRDYDVSLYLDSNVRLLCSPIVLLDKYLLDHFIAAPTHRRRSCIYDEAESVVRMGKAPRGIVEKQIEYYANEGYPKENGLAEMNVILRRHLEKEVSNLMDFWWDQLLLWSKRDQLSFCYSVWKKKLPVRLMDENPRRPNDFFFVECHKNDSNFNKVKTLIKRTYYMLLLEF